MTDTAIKAKAEALAAKLPEPQREMAGSLAENVIWMSLKLEAARELIGDSDVAIPYDNGGGQSGIRRNPAYDGYNALVSSYTKALKQLSEMLDEEIEDVSEDGIDEIVARRKSDADGSSQSAIRRKRPHGLS